MNLKLHDDKIYYNSKRIGTFSVDDCVISQLKIDTSYQKKGIGSAVVHLLEDTQLKSCKTVELISKPDTVDFWKKMGYFEEQELGMGEIQMKKYRSK